MPGGPGDSMGVHGKGKVMERHGGKQSEKVFAVAVEADAGPEGQCFSIVKGWEFE